MSATIRLDGNSLTRAQLVAVARGASVELDAIALQAVARACDRLIIVVTASDDPGRREADRLALKADDRHRISPWARSVERCRSVG